MNAKRSVAAGPKPIEEWLAPLNRSEVARQIGVDPGTVSRWHRRVNDPSGPQLQALARLLKIDANDIILSQTVVA